MRQNPNPTSICRREATTIESTLHGSMSPESGRAAHPRDWTHAFPARLRREGGKRTRVSIKAWSG
jgi:hypothetical protein